MLALSSLLASDPGGITIRIGSNVWSISLSFIIYLVIAAIVGLVAEAIVGGPRLPLGFVGAIVAALVGAWLLTNVIIIGGIGDIIVYNVPLVRALIGAIILVAIWHLLLYPFRRRYVRT